MRPATREWVKKAENDFESALALMRRKKVLADSVCFHCQSIPLAPAGGPYNSPFGLASTGQIPGMTLNLELVPEPSTFPLAGLGASALLVFRRRK